MARISVIALGLLLCAGPVCAAGDRWQNFAEDADQKYYLDRKSIIKTPEDTFTFWVKGLAKNKDYYRTEFNLNDLAQVLTSYELDCARGQFRVRERLLLDKNRRELNKILLPAGETPEFEPVPPESVVEMAMETVCEELAPAAASPVPTPEPPLGLQ